MATCGSGTWKQLKVRVLLLPNRCHNTEGSKNGTKEGKVAIYRRHKFCLVMVSPQGFFIFSTPQDHLTEAAHTAASPVPHHSSRWPCDAAAAGEQHFGGLRDGEAVRRFRGRLRAGLLRRAQHRGVPAGPGRHRRHEVWVHTLCTHPWRSRVSTTQGLLSGFVGMRGATRVVFRGCGHADSSRGGALHAHALVELGCTARSYGT